jgi:ubiquinone/menaquinone biosynthesis C-methylase UbiE
MHRVDYDRVAALYDNRWRDRTVDPDLLAFLDAHRAVDGASVRILDVGCGTGKQLAANRDRFPRMVMVGVDRFEGMLRIARSRCPAVLWIHADGAALPFSGSVFDYVTSQFSYQHVRRTPQLLAEVGRVLRPAGRFVMTNIDPWAMEGWLVYQYFPEARELDRHDFLPAHEFAKLLEQVGFRNVRVRRADRGTGWTLRSFKDFASERHRASQLMAIADDAYAKGLRRLREALAAGGDDVVVPSEFVEITIVADRP